MDRNLDYQNGFIAMDILDELSDLLHGHVFYGIDVNGKIYVYIDELEALKDKRFYIDLTGRGVSMEDAASCYISLLLNPSYVLRCNHKSGYFTERIRLFIRSRLHPIYHIEVEDYV